MATRWAGAFSTPRGPPAPARPPLISAVDVVLRFDIADEAVTERAAGRRVDPETGDPIYVHLETGETRDVRPGPDDALLGLAAGASGAAAPPFPVTQALQMEMEPKD